MKDMTKLSDTRRIVFSVDANLICLIPLQVSHENCQLGYLSTRTDMYRYNKHMYSVQVKPVEYIVMLRACRVPVRLLYNTQTVQIRSNVAV